MLKTACETYLADSWAVERPEIRRAICMVACVKLLKLTSTLHGGLQQYPIFWDISEIKHMGPLQSWETCIWSRILCYFAQKSSCTCMASLLSKKSKCCSNVVFVARKVISDNCSKVKKRYVLLICSTVDASDNSNSSCVSDQLQFTLPWQRPGPSAGSIPVHRKRDNYHTIIVQCK